ncbi:MAG: hypothetical protein RLZZ628_1261 [Bacteroidota bacterium]|jgi:hypothetical protein
MLKQMIIALSLVGATVAANAQDVKTSVIRGKSLPKAPVVLQKTNVLLQPATVSLDASKMSEADSKRVLELAAQLSPQQYNIQLKNDKQSKVYGGLGASKLQQVTSINRIGVNAAAEKNHVHSTIKNFFSGITQGQEVIVNEIQAISARYNQ